MEHPLQELNTALKSFVDQSDHFVLLLRTRDEELPVVVLTLNAIDEQSPADVYFIDTTPVTDAARYADEVVANVDEQLAEVNEERKEKGRPPFAPAPALCRSREAPPTERLRALVAHMATWMPPADDHRLVVALLPSAIKDQRAHAQITGALVPFHGYEPWMRGVRLILRDDGAAPFVADALRNAGTKSVLLYTTRVTVAAVADAAAREAENTELPQVQRINALLQCAALDVALGRYPAAIDKYGILYQYYDKHRVHEMKAVVLQGLGDVLTRLERLPGARDRYLQALDIASDAKSLPLILYISSSLGDVDVRLQAYAEAAYSYQLGADAAAKLGNVHARADLLEKCGDAKAALSEWRGSAESWTGAAQCAREFGYDARLATVLERLRDLSARAGHQDVAANYQRELSAVRARLS